MGPQNYTSDVIPRTALPRETIPPALGAPAATHVIRVLSQHCTEMGRGGQKKSQPTASASFGPSVSERHPKKKKKNYLYPFFLFVFFVPRSSRRLPRLNRGEEGGREKRNESTRLQHHEVTTT